MIDGGIVIMLIGALTLAIAPAERLIATRRWVRTAYIEPALRQAFPTPPPERRLERLAVSAEAAVQSAAIRRSQRRRIFRRPAR
jgi:LPS O-antigen subunit length determinant protein (WzzB/FepE family)